MKATIESIKKEAKSVRMIIRDNNDVIFDIREITLVDNEVTSVLAEMDMDKLKDHLEFFINGINDLEDKVKKMKKA